MQNSNIDRATRLGITLTILGVIWYVLIKSFDFTFLFLIISILKVYLALNILLL